ncbi:MerR family transcriptional regulator [Deinococcus roseus]|uniref:HTH merR-type domain-containing protein n=1 Tax=Deinococcus roseus TaxID=392414 RepID=A0ABQ2DG82_9DEIO|nr:MerR family transcriptional regulator [Deinococcus roseus]GGJ55209.1 hypothetical protein GCM10008938_46680 [Deinococcus roseus]
MLRKDILQKTGLTLAALRHYEKRGLLHPHRHPDGKFNRYDETHIEVIAQILMLQRLGMSLEKIQAFQEASVEEQRSKLREAINEGFSQVSNTQQALQKAFGKLLSLHGLAE